MVHSLTWKIIRENNSQFGKMKLLSPKKYFAKSSLSSDFFSKNFAFTKLLPKMRESKFLKLPNCATYILISYQMCWFHVIKDLRLNGSMELPSILTISLKTYCEKICLRIKSFWISFPKRIFKVLVKPEIQEDNHFYCSSAFL